MFATRPLTLIAGLAVAGVAFTGVALGSLMAAQPLRAQTRLEPFNGTPSQPIAPTRPAPGTPAPVAPTPRSAQAAPVRPVAPAIDPQQGAEQKAASNIEASNDYFVRLRKDIQRRQQKVATLEVELTRREQAYREMTQDLNDKAAQQAAAKASGTAAALSGAGTADASAPSGTGTGAEQGGAGDEMTQKYKQAEGQALYIRSLKYDISTQKKEIARLSELLRR